MENQLKIQFLGDSHVRRLAFFLDRERSRLTVTNNLSYSGITIPQLTDKVKEGTLRFEPGVPLFLNVGTNDMLKGVPAVVARRSLLTLLRVVRYQSPGIRVIVSQLPEFPRVQRGGQGNILREIGAFNHFLTTIQSPHTKVLRLSRITFGESKFIKYYPNSRRVDGIHFNKFGNENIVELLLCLLDG